MTRIAVLGAAVLLLSQLSFSQCIPFDQAQRHIGEKQCVTGKVLRVESGSNGVHYLDFCDDYRVCPFSVVVFSYDRKNIGDVRELSGKVVEIRGEVKEYDDRAEIVLESRKQLSGQASSIPSLPKNFDVEQRGNFSAGKFRAPHNRSTRRKKGIPTLPADMPSDVEN
jgi:predicted RNA-binding protein